MGGVKMSTMLRKSIVAALLCSLGAAATAAERWHGGTLKWVYTGTDGWIVLTFAADAPECTASGNPKYMYIVTGTAGVTATGARQMLATAMLALASGKQLHVAYDDSTPSCYINRLFVAN